LRQVKPRAKGRGGFGAALLATVGRNIGAGQHARVARIAWTGALAVAGMTGAFGLALAALYGVIGLSFAVYALVPGVAFRLGAWAPERGHTARG